jgi:hypothetical protein
MLGLCYGLKINGLELSMYRKGLLLFCCCLVVTACSASPHTTLVGGPAVLPPKYLSVVDWQQCTSTVSRGTWDAVCLPDKKPESCPVLSWEKLHGEAGSILSACASATEEDK